MADSGLGAELAAEVAIGADGFLFHRFEKAFEQVCDGTIPSPRQLARWVTVFEQRYAWCQARGIVYATLIIPERHVIYHDRLPDKVTVAPDRAVNRLLAAIAPPFRPAVLYPEAAMRAARAEGEVYFRTDEHINARGTYVCYRAILDHVRDRMPITPVPADELIVTTWDLSGNLGMRLEAEPTERAEVWRVPSFGGATLTYQNKPGFSRVEIFQNRDPSLPRAVVFGDSNLFSLWHFLPPHFSRLVFVHDCPRMFHDLVLSENPAIVLNIMSETTLGNIASNGTAVVPIDTDIADFLEHCGEALPRPATRTLLAIDFTSAGNSGEFVREGWGEEEAGHRWMVGGYSVLAMPEGLSLGEGKVAIEIDLIPHLRPPSRTRQELAVAWGDGIEWQRVALLTIEGNTTIQIDGSRPLTPGAKVPRFLRFDHPDGFSPLGDGLGEDKRLLSFAMRALALKG